MKRSCRVGIFINYICISKFKTMKKTILLFLIIAAFSNNSFSQARYIIRLKDKGTSPYSIGNPSAFLTSRAIQRRTRYNINIDSADLPVTPRYVDSIRLAGTVTILNTSDRKSVV